MSLQEFLAVYWKSFSFFDSVIWMVGIAVAAVQGWTFWKLKNSNAKFGPAFVELDRRCEIAMRFSSFGIEALPMMGLLGTVASLLVTLTGMKGTRVVSNVISDFAPALTTTFSGLFLSFVNLFILELLLKPEVQKIRRKGKTSE